MYLRQIADRIGDLLNDTTLKMDGNQASRTIGWVDEVYRMDICGHRPWSFLIREFTISVIAKYKDGTVNITQGSSSVTGVGTTWTASMVGRAFHVEGDDVVYRIKTFVSATSITLETVYEGTTAIGKSYKMLADRYLFPAFVDFNRIIDFKQTGTPRKIIKASHAEIDRKFPTRATFGDPKVYLPVGIQRKLYTTGTISGTSSAQVITGVSTAWITSNIEEFHIIKVGNDAYTVKSVDSDTSITIYEKLRVTIASGTTYTALLDNILFELLPKPEDLMRLDGRAVQRVPSLALDSDVPLLPENWHPLIVKGGYVKGLRHNNDTGVEMALAEFNVQLVSMVKEDFYEYDRIEQWGLEPKQVVPL